MFLRPISKPNLLFLLFILFYSQAFSQGCSDAGFCTMGAMKPDQPYNKKIELKLRSMEVSFYRGTTTLSPVVYVATADMNFSLNSKTSFQIKLPYQAVTGSLDNTSGLGDISLCFTRNMYSSEKFDLNLSLGGKIPTNQSDKENDEGNPLPMYYQTSLGSYDLITGISLISRKWLFATGVQYALNENGNQFLWTAWDGNTEHSMDYVKKYANSKELKRGVDVMFRVERNFRFSRVNFTLGLLPIYRVTNDEITQGGIRVKPEGAKGLAMSAILTTGYSFDVQSSVRLLVGHKIVQRDNNPDGLTRELVTTLSYCYRF